MFWNIIILTIFSLGVSSLIIEPLNVYHGFDKGILESSEGFSNDFKKQFGGQNQVAQTSNSGVNSDNLKKKSSGFDEARKGAAQQNKFNGEFSSENNQKKGHQNLNEFSHDSNSKVLGNKKAEAQGEGSLSKGHNSKGEQNYHHKDEYSKSSTFFDEENDEGDEFESKGENTSYDGSNLGSVMKNDHETDYNQGSHSNKEESNKGAALNEKSGNSQHKAWVEENGDHYKGDHTLGFDDRKYNNGFKGSHLFGDRFGKSRGNYQRHFLNDYPYF